jgi:hypothetical protein
LSELTEREREILGVALSSYGDVRPHALVRMAEILDLVEKLVIRRDLLSKGLARFMDARLRVDAERGVPT